MKVEPDHTGLVQIIQYRNEKLISFEKTRPICGPGRAQPCRVENLIEYGTLNLTFFYFAQSQLVTSG